MPRHVARWLAALLLSTPLIAWTSTVLFGWNWARSPLQQLVFEKTGRKLLIGGDLLVHLDWHAPRIIAQSVSFANPQWAKQAQMLAAERIEFTVDLGQLLHQRLAFTEVHLVRPAVSLEISRDGRKTWLLDIEQQDANARIPVGLLTLDQGRLNYNDDTKKTMIALELATPLVPLVGATSSDSTVFSAVGTYQGMAFSVHGRGGPVLALHDERSPYPLNLQVQAGSLHATAKGTITSLLKFSAADLALALTGKSLADLYPWLGLVLPVTPAFSLSGHLVRKPAQWVYEGFSGHIGHSDIAGSLQLDTAGPRPRMQGQVASRLLDLTDLGPVIGATTHLPETVATPPEARTSARLLPTRPLSTNQWFSMDANVRMNAQRLTHAMGIPLENLDITLNLRDGVLSLDPFKFGLAGGHIEGVVTMNAQQQPMQTHAKANARRVQLAALLPTARQPTSTSGQIHARLDLTGRGDSIAQMLATADGTVAGVLGKGAISQLLMEEVNLHLLEILHLKIAGDKSIALNCALADFAVKQGKMQPRTLVLDTEINTVVGSGRIDLTDETLDLKLQPRTRLSSPVALRSPIAITGSFLHPVVSLDTKAIAARGAGALALGMVTPLLAMLALVDIGNDIKSACPVMRSTAVR